MRLPAGCWAAYCPPMPETAVSGLYIHVPFCAHKCEYCAFYSAPPGGDLMARYVTALVRELEVIAADCRPDTLFFGGGTPSLLPLAHWETLLGTLHRLGLASATEWTVECNPATVSADKARLLRDAGVNRISMGVQSLDEQLLERLGRIHTRDQVFRSWDILRDAGFDNVNLDLMFAIPGQTLEQWRATIREALDLGPEHLSCYEVIYEEDTPLYEQLKAGRFDVDEDLACTLYDTLVDDLADAGYRQYEIANFARDAESGGIPSRACRHNVGYWRGRDCYGLGPSASEYVRGTRARNWANTVLYCEQLEGGRRAREFSEQLPPESRAGELAAFGLRMTAGWPYDEFLERTGMDLRVGWASEIRDLCARGWAEDTGRELRLTRQGLRFADAAGAAMLRPSATVRGPDRASSPAGTRVRATVP